MTLNLFDLQQLLRDAEASGPWREVVVAFEDPETGYELKRVVDIRLELKRVVLEVES